MPPQALALTAVEKKARRVAAEARKVATAQSSAQAAKAQQAQACKGKARVFKRAKVSLQQLH